ncbi:hypothetical protein BGZ99_000810 [Dissophora globulifera]|uniref:Arrestin C-terminal-like domain-containing protein n=1 Tax=Dissophora globulifera TaxID=979702 RepID=A0A9P6UYC5_9FUNG|nr:hypothetical protein BGZ99_000810 [Dissophora globulifera]
MHTGRKKALILEILNGEPGGPFGSHLFFGVPEGITVTRQLDVQHPVHSGHKIAPGRYETLFEFDLPSTLPSSCRYKHNGLGMVQYKVVARLRRKWSSDVVVAKDIWFISTLMPPPFPLFLPALPSPFHPLSNAPAAAAAALTPTFVTRTQAVTFANWKDVLPSTIIMPSNVVHFGQVIPVTIRLDPFLSTSKMAGKPLKLAHARLGIKQYAELFAANDEGSKTTKAKRYVTESKLKHWPTQPVSGVFQDTVLVQIPVPRPLKEPILVPTIASRVMTVQYYLKLKVDIIAKGVSGTMRFSVQVQVTNARPPGEPRFPYIDYGRRSMADEEVK